MQIWFLLRTRLVQRRGSERWLVQKEGARSDSGLLTAWHCHLTGWTDPNRGQLGQYQHSHWYLRVQIRKFTSFRNLLFFSVVPCTRTVRNWVHFGNTVVWDVAPLWIMGIIPTFEWRQPLPLKYQHISTKLHGVTSQRAIIDESPT